MSLDRRMFLRGAALGAAGLAVSGPVAGGEAGPASVAGALPSYTEGDQEADWSAVRARYSLSQQLTYFNTGGLGPAAISVLENPPGSTRSW